VEVLAGFALALTWQNLLYCFVGVVLGTFVGVLPGLGAMAALSLLVPLTFGLVDPISSIIFFAGLYYGTQYGGSTTSILLKLPGEPSTIITALDGHQMALNGRGGAALSIAAVSSFVAGIFSIFVIAFLAGPLSKLALLFGPYEYASLMVLGLIACVALTQGSFIKGLGMVLLGVLLGTVGTDLNSGVQRFTFDIPNLSDGIQFGILAMGVFGLGEIIYNMIQGRVSNRDIPSINSLYPTKQEIKESVAPTIRGSIFGSLSGLLPGTGAIISNFGSYIIEKKLSKEPEWFGRGHPAGVAGPEAANNAGAQTSFIPLLSLGIPMTPIMAIIISVLIVNGITPGPQIMETHATMIWALIGSMFIGNLFLLVLNLPLIGLWVKMLKVDWRLLYPLVIMVCVVGTYLVSNSWFDVLMLIPFCLLGVVLKTLGCEPAPLALGFVIGKMFEEHLRRALTLTQGDWTVFLERPISLTFLLISVSIIILPILFRSKKNVE
jgi:putative tricarboxylic transport membrane protein